MRPNTWTKEQTLLALAFYLCPPPGRKNWSPDDPELASLALGIGRSASSVCLKISNIKACDPNRTGKGSSHTSERDEEVMQEYLDNPDETIKKAISLLDKYGLVWTDEDANPDCIRIALEPVKTSKVGTAPSSTSPQVNQSDKLGLDQPASTSRRVNQTYFKRLLLDYYDGKCCITGIDIPQLLTASHIKPWSQANPRERVMPSNGLLLNAFHDRAFDRGFIALDDDYRIIVSPEVPHTELNDKWLYAYEGEKIHLPDSKNTGAWPNPSFLSYHRENIFRH